jgi:hypothetical protein
MEEIPKKLMEKILNMVNQKVPRCTQEISRHQK